MVGREARIGLAVVDLCYDHTCSLNLLFQFYSLPSRTNRHSNVSCPISKLYIKQRPSPSPLAHRLSTQLYSYTANHDSSLLIHSLTTIGCACASRLLLIVFPFLPLGQALQVRRALKVKVASLNRIRHSIGSQWSCLRSSLEDS